MSEKKLSLRVMLVLKIFSYYCIIATYDPLSSNDIICLLITVEHQLTTTCIYSCFCWSD